MQKKSKKFFLQAGQEDIIEPATFRLSARSLTCLSVQHTGLDDQVSPQSSTSCDRSEEEGYVSLLWDIPPQQGHCVDREVAFRIHQGIHTASTYAKSIPVLA